MVMKLDIESIVEEQPTHTFQAEDRFSVKTTNRQRKKITKSMHKRRQVAFIPNNTFDDFQGE